MGRRERLRERYGELKAWGIATRDVLLSRFHILQRILTEFLRVEVIDRSMVIGAQALLALVPMLIVLAAFLPSYLTEIVATRIGQVTGIDAAEASILAQGGTAAFDTSQVRTQTGLIGVVIAVLSATSFARAVQRAYTTVWDLPRIGGLRGRRRCLEWLLCWLLLMEMLNTVRHLGDSWAVPDFLQIAVQIALATGIWWFSIWLLLFGRVGWRPSFPAALISGAGMVGYAIGSTFVMPRYAVISADQFGVLGLVLALATWTVGFAFVIILSALLGRALYEDEETGALFRRLRDWYGERRARRAGAAGRP